MQSLSESRGWSKVTKPIFSNSKRYSASRILQCWSYYLKLCKTSTRHRKNSKQSGMSWIVAIANCFALFGARQYGVTTRKSFDKKYPRTLILSPDPELDRWFCPCILGWFWPILYFLCETSTWHLNSCPPEETWYSVILWVSGVLGQGLKSECADIFYQNFLWLLRHTIWELWNCYGGET